MDPAVPSSDAPAEAVPESSMTTELVKLQGGSHVFKITGYSSFRDIGIKFIKSQTFTVGGHPWCLRYFPNGIRECEDHVSVFLELENAVNDVNALFDIRFLDPVSGEPSADTLEVFGPVQFDAPGETVPLVKFMPKKDLEASGYLRDDCLTIRCNIVVIKDVAHTADSPAGNASIDEPDD